MTMPTGPAPRPLPNPGPPPAPVVDVDRVTGVPLCEHGDDAAACQLRHSAPSSTTHPQPTRPTSPPPPPRPTVPVPTSGHLPIAAPCDCGHGDLPQSFHLSPCPKARPLRSQPLAQMVNEVTRSLEAALFMLGRQWDPTTGPQQDGGVLPSEVDEVLAKTRVVVRIALLHLGDAEDLIPARQSTNSASLPGGPPNHPVEALPAMCLAWEYGECECHRHCLGDPRRGPEDHPDLRPGEGLTPGLDAGVVGAREGSDAAHARADAGSSHLAPAPAWASGDGRTSGHAEAAARQQVVGESPESPAAHVGLRAGASSDPRPVARRAGPDGRVAGVGFKLPPAKRWPW